MRKAQREAVAMMVRTAMTNEQIASAVNPSVTVAEVAAMRAEHATAEEAFQNSPEQQRRRKTEAMIEFYGQAVRENGGNYEAATAATMAEFGA